MVDDLIERLRERARNLYGKLRYRNDFDEAADALASLATERDQLRIELDEQHERRAKAEAEVSRLRGINANLMGDDEMAPRYTTKRLRQEIARSVESKDAEIERLRAKLAEAEKVISPFAERYHEAMRVKAAKHAVSTTAKVADLRAAAKFMEQSR